MWHEYDKVGNKIIQLFIKNKAAGNQEDIRIVDSAEKNINSFLSYDDVKRLSNHSIIFGKYRVKAVSRTLAHPTRIEREPEQKKQCVHSTTLPEWVTVHEDQNGCSSRKNYQCS